MKREDRLFGYVLTVSLMLILGSVGTFFVVALTTGGPGPWSWYAIDVVVVALLAVLMFSCWWFIRRRRVVNKARACALAACYECMYDLRQMRGNDVAGGVCPECGTPFNFRELVEQWRRFAK